MMALAHVMKDSPPDLILSGINRGANLAEDVTYSGTVSAAMEGALAGVRSIALSQVYAREGMGDTVPFAAAEAWAERVLAAADRAPFTPGTLVNVNFPALAPDAVKGIRVCRQGIRDYGRLRIVERTDPRGYRYFWFGLAPTVETPGHVTDLEVVADGYISVTPLHLDLTHEPGLDRWPAASRVPPSERRKPRRPTLRTHHPLHRGQAAAATVLARRLMPVTALAEMLMVARSSPSSRCLVGRPRTCSMLPLARRWLERIDR